MLSTDVCFVFWFFLSLSPLLHFDTFRSSRNVVTWRKEIFYIQHRKSKTAQIIKEFAIASPAIQIKSNQMLIVAAKNVVERFRWEYICCPPPPARLRFVYVCNVSTHFIHVRFDKMHTQNVARIERIANTWNGTRTHESRNGINIDVVFDRCAITLRIVIHFQRIRFQCWKSLRFGISLRLIIRFEYLSAIWDLLHIWQTSANAVDAEWRECAIKPYTRNNKHL